MSVPRRPAPSNLFHRWPHHFARRNETEAEAGQLILNIDPDINNPMCGCTYEANINVKTAPDPFTLSTACQSVLNYIGGPKGNIDVDIVVACLGQKVDGDGTRDVKIILDPGASINVNGASGANQVMPSSLELVSAKDNVFISAMVNIGFKMSASKADFQFIDC